jgi:bifunctional non-homologous end joining protein LigD
MNSKYPEIIEALASFPAESCALDGEIVVLTEEGLPSFQLLEGYNSKTSTGYLCYYVFDLLNLDGRTTSKLPLEKRKELLRHLIPTNEGAVRYSVSLDADPQVLASEVRKRGLEGIVAKRKTSLYEAGRRTGSWVKWKADNAGEFIIGGYQPGGSGGIDSIVVGQYEGKKLMYVSRVRAGFTPHQKSELLRLLSKLKTAKCPFANLPEPSSGKWGEGFTAEGMADCIWVKPQIECRVEFTEWTSAGHLRHARYAGLCKAR